MKCDKKIKCSTNSIWILTTEKHAKNETAIHRLSRAHKLSKKNSVALEASYRLRLNFTNRMQILWSLKSLRLLNKSANHIHKTDGNIKIHFDYSPTHKQNDEMCNVERASYEPLLLLLLLFNSDLLRHSCKGSSCRKHCFVCVYSMPVIVSVLFLMFVVLLNEPTLIIYEHT